MAAVSAESTVEEVKLRGAAITDEVLTRFSEPEYLAFAESPDVSEDASNVSPAMADPIQRKEHEAAMETPRGVQQRPCRPAATLALRIQLRAASLDVISRLAFETGPELGQLETPLNARRPLRSVLLKQLAELVSKPNQRGVFKIELRCASADLGRQRQVLQEFVPLGAAPSDSPGNALAGIPGEPAACSRRISVKDNEGQFLDWDQAPLDLSTGQIAERSNARG